MSAKNDGNERAHNAGFRAGVAAAAALANAEAVKYFMASETEEACVWREFAKKLEGLNPSRE